MRVEYQFKVMQKCLFEDKLTFIYDGPMDDHDGLIELSRWVVGHCISGGQRSARWGGLIINVETTPTGYEFDADNSNQHFIVKCDLGGPW